MKKSLETNHPAEPNNTFVVRYTEKKNREIEEGGNRGKAFYKLLRYKTNLRRIKLKVKSSP
uniref:Uncharacterized protein n=1 Tax=Oryza punctata TaxID=4537 RepID=A0A0E0MFN6_ORYPU